MMMVKRIRIRQVIVNNPQGLHARPAHALVKLAGRFAAEIEIIRNEESVDGKSILAILTLAAEQGDQLTIRASGEDAAQAVDALEELFLNDLGEDELELPNNDSTQDG
jgi:phosphocarrier protein